MDSRSFSLGHWRRSWPWLTACCRNLLARIGKLSVTQARTLPFQMQAGISNPIFWRSSMRLYTASRSRYTPKCLQKPRFHMKRRFSSPSPLIIGSHIIHDLHYLFVRLSPLLSSSPVLSQHIHQSTPCIPKVTKLAFVLQRKLLALLPKRNFQKFKPVFFRSGKLSKLKSNLKYVEYSNKKSS
jgi:hypothetical protein